MGNIINVPIYFSLKGIPKVRITDSYFWLATLENYLLSQILPFEHRSLDHIDALF